MIENLMSSANAASLQYQSSAIQYVTMLALAPINSSAVSALQQCQFNSAKSTPSHTTAPAVKLPC
jgi:hypothetical protein